VGQVLWICQQYSDYSVGHISGTSLWTCDWLLCNSLELREVTLRNLYDVLMQDKNVQILQCEVVDKYHVSISNFYVLIITLNPANSKTSLIQVYSIINRLYTRPSLKYVWKSQIIITCCDSSSPNWQYTNMANKNITYMSAACATSVWSPQLCQVMHNIISDYSVTSWAFEDILQHHASNSVEEGL
jgi:hypothetical protein